MSLGKLKFKGQFAEKMDKIESKVRNKVERDLVEEDEQ